MEKLCYVLWRPPDQTADAFARTLRETAAPALVAGGAGRVAVNVSDGDVAHALAVRISQLDPPFDAVVSFWVDEADARGPLEASLRAVAGRAWPFLVVESVPRRNRTHLAPPGERTPGINMVACITPKAGMPYADFIRHWHTVHRAAALETQRTYAYVRNEIVRSFAPDAPPWAAIVEEGFPVPAVTDPMQWYDADGDAARFKRNVGRMMESCMAFLALDRIESHPLSEYVYGR